MNALNKIISYFPYLLLGIGASFLPLIGDFYLETAQVSSIIFSIFVIWSFSESVHPNTNVQSYGFVHFRHLGITYIKMGIFLIPILISSLISGCFTATGFLFVLFIPVVGVFFVYSILKLLQVYFRHFKIWATLITVFVMAIMPLINLKMAPHVFLFNPIWGWFPGPIYDEQVVFPVQLVYHGLFVITLSSLFVILNKNIFNIRSIYKTSGFFVFASLIVAFLFNWSNLGLGYSLKSIKNSLGGVSESEHFVLIYDEGVFSKNDVDYWLYWHEFHFNELIDELQLEPGHKKIVSVLYRDVWQKLKFTGAKYTSYVPVWNFTPQLHLDQQTADNLLRHELVHVLLKGSANAFIGANLKVGITEGVAVALEDPRSTTFTRDEILVNSELEINSDMINDAFSFFGFYGGRSAINYSVSGSFVQYLLQQYPVDNFKCIYGGSSFDDCYDSFPNIQQNWVNYIQSIRPDSGISSYARSYVSRESIFEKKCARFVSDAELMFDQSQKHLTRSQYYESYRLLNTLNQLHPNSLTIWMSLSETGIYLNNPVPQFEFSSSHTIVDSINVFIRSADFAYIQGDHKQIEHFINGLKDLDTSNTTYKSYINNQLALRGFGYQGNYGDVDTSDIWKRVIELRYRNDELKKEDPLFLKNLWLSKKYSRSLKLSPYDILPLLHIELNDLSENNIHFLISNLLTFNRTAEESRLLISLIDMVEELAVTNQKRMVLNLYNRAFEFSETYH